MSVKTKSKIPQKIVSFVMVLVTLCRILFSNAIPVHASSLSFDEQTGYVKADDIVLKKPAHNQSSEPKPNPNKK